MKRVKDFWKEEDLQVRKVEIERVSIISSRSFEEVKAALNGAIGHPDLVQLGREIKSTQTYSDLESKIKRSLGRTDLMLFMELDEGEVIRKENNSTSPKIERFIVGNPLIMKEMVKYVPDAGTYAPVTILLDERQDGVHLTYDRMASLIASYGSPEALEVAKDLDLKVENLLRECAT